MEQFFLIIVIILFILAVSDLIVGVSNDAVNFLNSAIGSKAAPEKIIFLIATAGILFGATFSNGMMEVARNGIFNPYVFTFSHIIIIFLAVMITDVLLLDLFNTFGLPTSTTVSVVFELLGAAVGMAFISIRTSAGTANDIGDYINSERALLIISGILLSIVIAFTAGMIIQYVSRIIFSFNFNRTARYFGAIWGGLAIASITYFILIKGASGSSFINAEQSSWIKEHSNAILGICFGGWTVLMLLLQWLFNTNIFKVIVLFGTFALAMAFAGNDLVNFIGVPLAGFESYKIFSAQSSLSADAFLMQGLMEEVKTPTFFLLLAGIVMALALWFSKKARSVTKTEVNLGNQDLINERFSSFAFARAIVRIGIRSGNVFRLLIPEKISKSLDERFDDKTFKKEIRKNKSISFDLVRASVNLAVSSSLIALATSYRLPLSTTYVTFMVAMGTSLSDRAWGRESAVYRVSGVLTVIGGWFFTALSAFTIAMIIALLIHWGGPAALIAMILLIIFILYRTYVLHKNREETIKKAELEVSASDGISAADAGHKFSNRISKLTDRAADLYETAILSLIAEKRRKLAVARKRFTELQKDIKSFRKNTYQMILSMQETEADKHGEHFMLMLAHLNEMVRSLEHIIHSAYEHVDNNHETMKSKEADDLMSFCRSCGDFIQRSGKMIPERHPYEMGKLHDAMMDLRARLSAMGRDHLKRIRTTPSGTRASLLHIGILSESRNLIHSAYMLVSASDELSRSIQSGTKG
ncbi:MAG: inorganic phosphate transporter [Bacteroidales bacterium]|nr:inorganic phosphate transporter [Bacteroidales bacterium]